MSEAKKGGLVPRLRFKDDEGKEYPGWKEFSLNQVSTIAMGVSPPSDAYNQNQKGLPLIQGNSDIKDGRPAPKFCTETVTRDCLPNDTLLSVRAPVGEVFYSDIHACIGRGMASIRANSSVLIQAYLHNYMIWYKPKWKSISQGSTFGPSTNLVEAT